MVRGKGWAGSLVSSGIRLLLEEDLAEAEAAEGIAERAGAKVTESLEVEIDRTAGASG